MVDCAPTKEAQRKIGRGLLSQREGGEKERDRDTGRRKFITGRRQRSGFHCS